MNSYPASRKLLFPFILAAACIISFSFFAPKEDNSILSFEVNPAVHELKMYLNQADGSNYKSIGALKAALESRGEELIFAMNGGMYMEDLRPLGLYIENGEVLRPLNLRTNANGNFYLQPNGVFYLTKGQKAEVVSSEHFALADNINYATQSGPMLLIEGEYHPAFNQGSSNLNIRNGVGILPNGNVLFALSKTPINFYDFATFFKERGCRNALYLDGFVSRAYLPSLEWTQVGGNFGVIIGVCE